MMRLCRIATQWARLRRLRIVALACVMVAALAAGLTALGARFAAPPATLAPALVEWRGDDGASFRIALDATRYERFLEQRAVALAQERQRLAAIADSAIEREVADVYGRMTLRIPDYADWVYGWIDNYITTYLVIHRTFVAAILPPEGVARRGLFAAISEGMHEVIGEHFTSIVVEPANPQRAMRDALGRLEGLLAGEWQHVLAADRAAWDSFLLREGLVRDGLVRARSGQDGDARCAMPAPQPPSAPETLTQVDRIDSQQTDLFAVRVARPPTFFVFRIGIAPILTTGSLVSITAIANPVAAAALAATSLGLWALDFAINEMDGWLNRGTFETRLARAIDGQRRADTASLTTGIDGAIAAAFATLVACRAPVLTAQR